MNTSLDHLPESKREQLKAIASVIRAHAPVEMVILFGSYARGNWVEDLATGYFSDFDLMAVVATPEQAKDVALWSDISDEIRRLAGRTPVTFTGAFTLGFMRQIHTSTEPKGVLRATFPAAVGRSVEAKALHREALHCHSWGRLLRDGPGSRWPD